MGEAAQARDTSDVDASGAIGEASMGELSWAEPLEEPDRWCVDHGDAIVVRSTAEVAAAYEAGEVTRQTLVWREGHAIWEPLGHFSELMSSAPRSGLRPRRPRGDEGTKAVEATPASEPRPGLRPGRGPLAFSSAFALGVVLGVLVALPFAWPEESARVDRLAPRLDATSQAAAALVNAR